MKPPRLARWLVRLSASTEDRDFLLEDLTKRFEEIAQASGAREARRWYWSQALSTVPAAFSVDGERVLRAAGEALSDVRFALRTVRRRPLYAVGVAGTLGLAFTAATITFAVVWRVWLAPLEIPDPEGVVRLYEVEPSGANSNEARAGPGSGRHQLSPNLLEDLRARSWRSVESVSALITGIETELDLEEGPLPSSNAALSPDGFGIFGIVPILGRLPSRIESEVVLSERFWRVAFGADPDVVGARFTEDGFTFEVVGVVALPPGMPGDPDELSLIEWNESGDANRNVRFIDVVARVRPGYSAADASTEMSAFVAGLSEDHPVHRGWTVEAVPLEEDLVRPFRSVLALLLGAAVVFLLLAAVNMAGLVAIDRIRGRRDRWVRVALGVSRGRLLAASVVESLVLGALGAAAGLAVASWLVGPVRAMVPQDVPQLDRATVTPGMIVGGSVIAVVLSLAIGLYGHLVSSWTPWTSWPSAARRRRAFGRKLSVVGQVALTSILVAGGTGVLHHITQLRAVDLGFEPTGVWATTADLPDNRYPSGEAKWGAWRAVRNGIKARELPAAVVANAPMAGEPVPPFGIQGEAGPEEFFYDLHLVSAEYFSVMGVEVLAGRVFGPAEEDIASDGLVVVSQAFAEAYFGSGTDLDQTLGRQLNQIALGGTPAGGPTVLGVVESTRHSGPGADARPEVYVPFTSFLDPPGTLLVRGDRDRVAEAVATVTGRVDPDQMWTPLIPYADHVREWFAPLRLQWVMIGTFGVLGLLLVSLGLYSVMAYQVALARHEIGVRKAVGARDHQVMVDAVARGLTLAFAGVIIGLLAWYWLLPWTRALVNGIDSGGALVPLTVVTVVGAACLASTFTPALRAARVDPTVTLRAE